jgi:pyridoxal phosphate enzyme (YggS family)
VPDRRAELAANLALVSDRIAAACRAAGRDPDAVTLIAVTKTFPASDARLLVELGVFDLGENRDPEAAAKAAELAGLSVGHPTASAVRWHFIGQLQRNKARSVVRYASLVHSVDRPALVTALADALADAVARQRPAEPLDVLLQVSLDDAPGRGGVPAKDLVSLGEAVEERAELRLRGVMAVAPLGADPDPAFGRLAELAAGVRERWPAATVLSAGMSADLEAAVRHGATHVRVGSALLGRRGQAGLA